MYDVEDDRMDVVDSAIKCKLGTKEDIELYEELSLALELMNKDDFRVEGSRINNGIDFNIMTPYPNGLPESVGTLFFNVSTDYKVCICETNFYSQGIHNDPSEMNFKINIKKC